MDKSGIKVRIFNIENGLREYKDIKIIRIISKDYNLLIMKDYICYIRFLARNQNQGRAALIAIYPTTYRRRGFLARGLLNPFCTVRLSICPKVIRTPVYPVGIIAKD